MAEKQLSDQNESASTPDASPERNKIAEQHSREFPEGDPSVRRQHVEEGTAGGRPVKLHGDENAEPKDLGHEEDQEGPVPELTGPQEEREKKKAS